MQLKKLIKLPPKYSRFLYPALLGVLSLVSLVIIGGFFLKTDDLNKQVSQSNIQAIDLETHLASTSAALTTASKELVALMSEDQYQINQALEATISAIEDTYQLAVRSYENLLKLKDVSKKTDDYDESFAEALKILSERDYIKAEDELKKLNQSITLTRQEIASQFVIPENVPVSNSPPGSGYSRQQVQTDVGTFMVSIITADLNSTRVIVDTASGSDCSNDCPVLSLGDYVGRNGAFAGVNGSYFCPASYPSCTGKTNSFDTLLMNKDKKYFNSGNNVYSTVPAVIFSGNSARFVGRSLEWGRDTGVDAVLANHPLLVSGGNVVFGGDGDPKKGSRAGRSFVGASGGTAYIGVVHSATVAESARVLQKMGIQSALNLDSGGSTALWSSGYKVGPGRNLPNVLLFVRK